jgi:hypothetical protein
VLVTNLGDKASEVGKKIWSLGIKSSPIHRKIGSFGRKSHEIERNHDREGTTSVV